jgi:hypothetical protein
MLRLSSHGIVTALAVVIGLAAAADGPASMAAQPASLDGSWSGGGNVQFSSGRSERARCRASFSKRGANGYDMTAVCATTSGRASQTAQLTRSGANRYSGNFQNSEFGVSGLISISVNGNSLSASLSGGGGSANLNLNR